MTLKFQTDGRTAVFRYLKDEIAKHGDANRFEFATYTEIHPKSGKPNVYLRVICKECSCYSEHIVEVGQNYLEVLRRFVVDFSLNHTHGDVKKTKPVAVAIGVRKFRDV